MKDQSPEVVAQVRSVTAKYKYGNFDSMTDSFEYSNVRKDIPQARHIFVENEISGELKEKIFQALKSEYSDLDQFETVPEDAGRIHLDCFYNDNLSAIIHRASHSADFWQEHHI